MSVRLILCLMCVCCAGALGILKGMRMRKRILALKQLLRFFTHVSRELEFGREPLPEIFEKMAARSQKPLADFLKKTAGDMRTDTAYLHEIFSRNVKEYMTCSDLEKEDLQLLTAFGHELGYQDRQLQIHTVENYQQEIRQRTEALEKEYPGNCRLFRVLGISAGLLVAVLLW